MIILNDIEKSDRNMFSMLANMDRDRPSALQKRFTIAILTAILYHYSQMSHTSRHTHKATILNFEKTPTDTIIIN